MIPDLIYDLGMHDGGDTAFYLSKGFRVVAVEANPALVEHARCRFAGDIEGGRLTILNVAITAEAGPVEFWISDKNDGWSSLARRAASRQGSSSHPIVVEGKQFADILAQYGVPYYAKIDIELADHYCLAGVQPDDRPRYISVEADSLEHLCRLQCLGYNAFKIIDQNRHNQPYQVCHKERLLDRLRLAIEHRRWMMPHYKERLRRALKHSHGQTGSLVTDASKTTPPHGPVPFGPSGPFGEETVGDWQTLERVAYEFLNFSLCYHHRGTLDPWGYFDFHATTRPPMEAPWRPPLSKFWLLRESVAPWP
jgi:FkbM family methyltransferase